MAAYQVVVLSESEVSISSTGGALGEVIPLAEVPAYLAAKAKAETRRRARGATAPQVMRPGQRPATRLGDRSSPQVVRL